MTVLASRAVVSLEDALGAFEADLRSHYGPRLAAVYLFGSRARDVASLDSDADVAVILNDAGVRFWDEKAVLIDLAYEHILDCGIHIQAWPFTRSEWEHPQGHPHERLLRNARRDARAVAAADAFLAKCAPLAATRRSAP
jgi:predicted nucleotidyltransferase